MDSHAVIEFEEYPDLEFRLRISGVSVKDFGTIVNAYNEAARRFMPEPLQALCELVQPFVDDETDLAALDVNLMLAVVREWVTGVRSVPLPLPRRSSAGEQSEDPETSPES